MNCLLTVEFKLHVNIILHKIMKNYNDKAGEHNDHRRRLV